MSFISKGVVFGFVAMALVVITSNILVQYPINDWITWGAFTYPVAFLVTDITNRAMGAKRARLVVYCGFALAVCLSIFFSTTRIAVASGTAFLIAQLIDVRLFDHFRNSNRWWVAPLFSSGVGSIVDTTLFFSIAFAGLGLPWITWGLGDLTVKMTVAFVMLVPFGVILRFRLLQRV